MAEDSLGITKNHIAAQKTSQNESDQNLISPFNITHESNIKVMRKKEMIINWRNSWLWNKFSLQAH